MSGTSLDGVDLAFCTFTKDDTWRFEIVKAKTYLYTQKWQDILANVQELQERILRDVDLELGKYFAQLVENFINEYQLIPDFVSSHGHTALHNPDKGVTLQIGSGEVMAEELLMVSYNCWPRRLFSNT